MTAADEYSTYRAEGAEALTLYIWDEIPSYRSLDEQDKALDTEARRIADLLASHLPGAVLDRLTAHLMMRKASQLLVVSQK